MSSTTASPNKTHDPRVIDGKAFAAGLRADIKEQVAALKDKHGVVPGLAVVLVGEDPASQVYVRNKGKACKEVGFHSVEIKLPANIPEQELLETIDKLNADPAINGILVQLPIPGHMNETQVINRIDPKKDVDGFHVINVGKLVTGQKNGMVPCTPLGCLMLLRDRLDHDLTGKKAVVIGRSNIVGKPIASLLLAESCTVTVAHSKTKDLPALCREADIVIAAVGRPEMVKGEWLKEGTIVIDVGINRIGEEGNSRLVGDVDFASALPKAGGITPVPGGVGPMTIACLLYNTLRASIEQHDIIA